MIKIEDLKANEKNPRKISAEALAGLKVSLARYGDIGGIVWNRRTERLVAGHQRIRGLKALYGAELKIEGDQLIAPTGETWPVRVVDWDEETELGAMVSANNPHITGEFTDELQGILDQLKDADEELFAGLELEKLVEEVEKDQVGQCDPDEGPDEIPTIAQPGDLWELGEHRLLCGSSRNPEDVRRLMAGHRAVLFATDPPYLVDYDGSNHFGSVKHAGTTWDNAEQGPEFYEEVFAAALGEALLEDAPWYCWHASRRQAMLEAVWIKLGIHFHQQIIWTKDRPVLGRSHYLWGHEPCLYGWRKGNEPRWRGKERLSTVWYVEGVRTSLTALHPTSKPAELFAVPMRHHSDQGEICYEAFGGSGSQIIAAEMTGRRCFSMEIEPRYCDVIIARWCKFSGRKRVKRNGVEVLVNELPAGERV